MTNLFLDYYQKLHQNYDFDGQSTFHAISHIIEYYNIIRKGKKVNQIIITLFKKEQKPTLQN